MSMLAKLGAAAEMAARAPHAVIMTGRAILGPTMVLTRVIGTQKAA